MKRLILVMTMLVFTSGIAQIQNKENVNVTKETTTTKATVKTNKGDKTVERETTLKAKKELELQNVDNKRVNYKIKDQPYIVKVVTSYSMGDDDYLFAPDEKGFTVKKENSGNNKMMPYARARRMTEDGYYIMTTANNQDTYFGSFDEDGNFIMESYDPKRDEVVTETYMIDK